MSWQECLIDVSINPEASIDDEFWLGPSRAQVDPEMLGLDEKSPCSAPGGKGILNGTHGADPQRENFPDSVGAGNALLCTISGGESKKKVSVGRS